MSHRDFDYQTNYADIHWGGSMTTTQKDLALPESAVGHNVMLYLSKLMVGEVLRVEYTRGADQSLKDKEFIWKDTEHQINDFNALRFIGKHALAQVSSTTFLAKKIMAQDIKISEKGIQFVAKNAKPQHGVKIPYLNGMIYAFHDMSTDEIQVARLLAANHTNVNLLRSADGIILHRTGVGGEPENFTIRKSQ